jgi:hypothetical protein
MLGEVVRRCRCAVRRQIGRRRNKDAPGRSELACDQARIRERRNADRDVDTLLDWIDEAVIQRHLDTEVRIGGRS